MLPKRANMLSSSSGTVVGGRFFTSSVVVLRAPALAVECVDSSASTSMPCCAKYSLFSITTAASPIARRTAISPPDRLVSRMSALVTPCL
jgi:hypothetical protein